MGRASAPPLRDGTELRSRRGEPPALGPRSNAPVRRWVGCRPLGARNGRGAGGDSFNGDMTDGPVDEVVLGSGIGGGARSVVGRRRSRRGAGRREARGGQ